MKYKTLGKYKILALVPVAIMALSGCAVANSGFHLANGAISTTSKAVKVTGKVAKVAKRTVLREKKPKS